jgi:hypothetical protein
MGRLYPSSAILLAGALVGACGTPAQPHAGEQTWIEAGAGTEAEVLTRHLRGLDVAMVEIDYRFAETYHAGADGNWPYAEYQAAKLRLAMDLALERRPGRAASARAFFYPALERVQAAVAEQDGTAFMAGMTAFAESCSGCHIAEDVPTFGVAMPPQRRSSVVPQ